MLIYRVEHKETKLGPYRWADGLGQDNLNLYFDIIDAHSVGNSHSGWTTAFGRTPYWSIDFYKAGFESMEHLTEWFDGFIDRLITAGFEIVTYEIDEKHVQLSYDQLRYRYSWAANRTVIKTFDEYADQFK